MDTAYRIDALLPLGFVAIGSLIAFLLSFKPNDRLPLQNGKAPMELFFNNAKKRFLMGAPDMLKSGIAKTGKTFLLMTDMGPRYIVPPEYAQDLQNHRNLTTDGIIDELLHAHLPGLEVFQFNGYHGQLMRRTIRKKLWGPALDKLTEPLNRETSLAFAEICTDNPDWHEIRVKETVLKILTRSFTGTFLGEELASNPKWFQSFEDYSASASLAAGDLRVWPKPLHSLVHWFLPKFQKLRADLAESCRLIAATLGDNKEALRMGTRADEHSRFPMVEWLQELSGGKTHDPTIIHMSMFVVGLHTTTDMLTQLVYDLSGREELVQQLRQEILSVIAEDGGLQKGSLDKLKLLDSVMKESQRLKPANIAPMGRTATKDFNLPDGTKIAKGDTLLVPAYRMWDESVYPNADQFVPDRFFKMRQAQGSEANHQCASTSPIHMGFGHGVHACPGRFFAVQAQKITLCHLLLKYDLQLVDGRPSPQPFGMMMIANMVGKVSMRRRQESAPL